MDKVSKEIKIGVAFVVAIIVLYFGISFLKGINLLKPSNSYMVTFNDISGLTQSTPVLLNGYQIGLVYDMELDPNNQKQVITYLTLNKDVKIPKDSKVYLDVSALGTASLLLEAGTSTSYVTTTDTLIGLRKKGMMDAVGDVVPELGNILPRIDSILIGIQAMVNNPALGNSLQNVDQITAELTTSTKQLNSLMANLNKNVPTITNNLANVTTNLSESSKQLNQIDIAASYKSIDASLKNIEHLSSQLSSKEGTVGLLLNDRQLYDSLNMTISNMSLLLKDLKENPQRYINVKVF